MIIPRAVNTRMTIPPGLDIFTLAKGKSKHFVLALLDRFQSGHSAQLSEPGIGLIVPRGQETHCQQQGEVMDFLVPVKHLSTHSDFGGPSVREFQRIFPKNLNRLSCSALSSHFPTTTSFKRVVFPSCTCWTLAISQKADPLPLSSLKVIFPVSPTKLTLERSLCMTLTSLPSFIK